MRSLQRSNAPSTLAMTLALAILGAAMATAEILPGSMMPLMADGLNATEGMIGQATTASAIVAIITSLSLGAIVGDRDRRLLMIIFTGSLVLSNIGVTISPNVWTMLASRLLLGAAIGVVWGLIPAIVIRMSPPGKFARTFATVMIGVSVSGVVAAPSAAFIGAQIGWRWVYLGATVLAVAALIAITAVFPSMPATGAGVRRDVRGTIGLPGMVTGMSAIMFIFGGSQAFYGYLVPFLEEITGLGASRISMMLLFFGVSGLVGTLLAPRSLAISINGVMAAASGILGLLLGMLLLMGHLLLPTIVILVLWSVARAHIGVGANAWIAHNFADHAESAGGLLVAVIQTSMMLGAILGGVLIDNLGAKAPPAAGGLILALAAAYVFVGMKPRTVPGGVAEPAPTISPVMTPLETPPILTDELA